MDVVETGNLTFLFAAADSSARWWHQRPETMQQAYTIYEAAICRAIEGQGGHLFQTVDGDFYAAFANPRAAIVAAIAIQQGLINAPWPTPIERLPARIALHSGTAEIEEGMYQATPILNRLSRVLAITHAGQMLISEATAQLVAGDLPNGVQLRDLGERRLRDLPQPLRLYQLITPDLPHNFPPLKTLDRRANNLPAQPTSFIGREQDVATVANLLRQPDVRLVTLSGPGGSGKTRLSLEVADELLDEHEDGVFFVPLAPISDPALVASTIAHTLGLQEEGSEAISETLKRHLRDKQMLLVLDNFEQVVAAAPLISALLAAAPQLRVMISSREILATTEEYEYAVSPFALPDLAQLPDPAELHAYPVIELFIQRAQAVKFDFTLSVANAAAVASICVRLDGLPLAVELAAARCRELNPSQILDQLQDRLTTLISTYRNLTPRQRSLRGAIEWSYDLLGEEEKLLFRRLAVFVGGWDAQAAMQVCSGISIEEQQVPLLLAQLANKSLVQAEAAGERIRYLMLETIREYALMVIAEAQAELDRYTMQQAVREYAEERLVAHDEVVPLRERHAAYYLDLVEQAASHLIGAEQAGWLARLETEHDNLRVALAWLQRGGQTEPMLRMVSALWRFWYMRGYLHEGRTWLESTLAISSGEISSLRARALNSALALAGEQGDYLAAQEFGRQALAMARQLGDNKNMAAALNSLGILSVNRADFATAQQLLSESLALEQQTGDLHRLGMLTVNLGVVAQARGDYPLAGKMYEQGIAIHRQSRDLFGLAMALFNASHIAIEEGDLGRAEELLDETQRIHEELGNPTGLVGVIGNRGKIAEQETDLATAQARYEQSLALAQKDGNQGNVAYYLEQIARIALKRGDIATARVLYRQALTKAGEIKRLSGIPDTLEGIAALLITDGQLLRAAQLLAAAESLREVARLRSAPSGQRALAELTAQLSAKLSAAELATAQATGRAMSMAEAIDYALEEND